MTARRAHFVEAPWDMLEPDLFKDVILEFESLYFFVQLAEQVQVRWPISI